MSYKAKPRPNFEELAILDGFLNGGGYAPTVQREAYWDKLAENQANTLYNKYNSKP